MRPILLLAGLTLAGCATQAGFDARMQTLVGLPVGDLVQRIGVPDSDFTTPDGRRFLQYERLGSSAPMPAPAFGVGLGSAGWRGAYGGGWGWGWGWGAAYPAYAPPLPCRVTFEIRTDHVASFTRSGGGCVATEPG